jgi:hypothetical protein
MAPSTTACLPTSAPARRSAGLGTALGTGALAGVVAAALNLVVSAVARGPLATSDDFVPLTPGPVVMWTVLGAVIGALGWRLVVRTSARSRTVLTRLVPTVLVLSFVPDVALLVTDSVPGQTTTGVLALMVMHVVTAVVAVTAYGRRMPAA